jgi:hypothetical protein
MNDSGAAPVRLTVSQALGWGLAVTVVAALIVAFFVYGRLVRPLVGS